MSEEVAKPSVAPDIIITVKIGGVVEQRNLSDDLRVDEARINN